MSGLSRVDGTLLRPMSKPGERMTKISDILRRGPSHSFEFFPPRTPVALAQLEETLKDLELLTPSYVSVTYGAGGTTRNLTHDLVVRLRRETSMTPMAHLACAAHTRSELTDILLRYKDAGIDNILALRGDPPRELGLPPGELAHAVDLVALVRDLGDFSVGVAVHPEDHPASTDRESDRSRQAEKLAVADFGVSQFFFEARVWLDFLSDLKDMGVRTPVIPGIMPVTNIRSVKRMAELSGADFPRWLETRLAAVADDTQAMHRVGVEASVALCRELMEGGVRSFHFYTLNRSGATREIYRELGFDPTTRSPRLLWVRRNVEEVS